MQIGYRSTPTDPILAELCEASSANDLERVKTLVEQWQTTPLQPAWERTHPLEAAACAAATSKSATIVSHLLDQGLHISGNIVEAAIGAKSTDVLQVLLDHGWDINSISGHGAELWLSLTMPTVLNNNALLMWFLDHGASPNVVSGSWSHSALDAAANFSSPEAIAVLLEHGAIINNTNALHKAVRSTSRGRREVVEFLLDSGVDIDAIEFGLHRPSAVQNHGTALHYAASHGREDLVQLLLDRGASTAIRDRAQRTAEEVAKRVGYTRIAMRLSGELGEGI